VIQSQEQATDFKVVVTVADEYHPMWEFPMGEGPANAWIARLTAILNG